MPEWPEQAEINLCMWIQFESPQLPTVYDKSPCKDQEDCQGSELSYAGTLGMAMDNEQGS